MVRGRGRATAGPVSQGEGVVYGEEGEECLRLRLASPSDSWDTVEGTVAAVMLSPGLEEMSKDVSPTLEDGNGKKLPKGEQASMWQEMAREQGTPPHAGDSIRMVHLGLRGGKRP